jgi:hypothetical protein
MFSLFAIADAACQRVKDLTYMYVKCFTPAPATLSRGRARAPSWWRAGPAAVKRPKIYTWFIISNLLYSITLEKRVFKNVFTN